MKPNGNFAIVLVTAPTLAVARMLARKVVAARLVACANLLPGIESHYWWTGKIDSAKEVLLLLKTTSPRLAALERLVLAAHPYDTPEFVVLRLAGGTRRYLDWLTASVEVPVEGRRSRRRLR